MTPEQISEPHRMGARVIDREGDTWRRGRTRWSCEAQLDGGRVQQVARMGWGELTRMYGPLRVLDLNERKAVVPDKAPRCAGSNTHQSVEPPDSWSSSTHKPCTVCGQRVKFRVRGADLPPWARVLPHRTDGTPCR